MTSKIILHLIAAAISLSSLTQCSFDPQLKDLKVGFVLQEAPDNLQIGGRPGGKLANNDCCKLIFNQPQELAGKTTGPTPIRRDNGNYLVMNPSFSLPLNREIQFYLDCALSTPLVKDPLPQPTDGSCAALSAFSNICSGKFVLTGQTQVLIRVVPSASLGPGTCTADN